MPKIYFAFSNTGKTYFCKHNPGWIDLDWYVFSKAINSKELLIEAVKYYKYYGFNIFISYSGQYLTLKSAGINIDGIILPTVDLKEEYINRVQERSRTLHNTQDGFAQVYPQYFDSEQRTIQGIPGNKIYLKSGQYISDILDSEGNIKEA